MSFFAHRREAQVVLWLQYLSCVFICKNTIYCFAQKIPDLVLLSNISNGLYYSANFANVKKL